MINNWTISENLPKKHIMLPVLFNNKNYYAEKYSFSYSNSVLHEIMNVKYTMKLVKMHGYYIKDILLINSI